jgi:hypothetical protein
MSTTLVPPKPKTRRDRHSLKPPSGGNGFDGEGFGGGGPGPRGWSVPAHAYRTGMWMALVAIVMLFAAFTSAMVVRKGLNNDWISTSLPHILYVNTAILVASSCTLEISRRSLAKRMNGQFAGWLYATLALGLAFVGGQLSAWHSSRRLPCHKSQQFVLLLADGDSRCALAGRNRCLALPCASRPAYYGCCRKKHGRGRHGHLLALYGRALDLPLSADDTEAITYGNQS